MLRAMPWWVTWVVLPLLVIAIFGGLIMSVVGFVVGLLFRVLLLVALVGVLVYALRKFTRSRSRGDW